MTNKSKDVADDAAATENAAKPARSERVKASNPFPDAVDITEQRKAFVTPSGSGQVAQKGEAAARAAGRGPAPKFDARNKRKASKVLFFIGGSRPTDEEYAQAIAIGPGVMFRNARKIVLGAPLENCDAVAGPAVPPDYADRFPPATEDHEVEEGEMPDGVLVRPKRTLGGGTAPDDVRPGTVDDGIAHASGTGSSQPGVATADPTRQGIGPSKGEAQATKDAWRTATTPGALG